ncbi:helix-turn-helix domain-containing protein [Rheinheimera oceanensis]|uniref:helix-turn-helix domain-containing protein n=1 Tax=Rheinheimera oceanensis TaxID=2817449 RepID=UPI001BFD12F1|nr:helix-turn-helix transcriptional regulator [Rheinheimera oceanensis]
MSETAKKLGIKLRARRTELKLSQDELALNAEIDRSYIGRIERGEVNITIDILYKIAFCLQCHPRDFLP